MTALLTAPALDRTHVRHELLVRNKNGQITGEVPDWYKISGSIRFNDIDALTVTMPADSPAADLLQSFGGGLVLYRHPSPSEPAQELFNGPIFSWIKSKASNQGDASGDVGAGTLTVTATDDLFPVASARLAYPSVNQPYPVSGDVFTGSCEDALLHFVGVNSGPAARADRRIANLVLAPSQRRGSSVTQTGLWDNLLTLLQGVALKGGDLGFRTRFDAGTITFEVYAPRDLTSKIAPLGYENGNVRSLTYQRVAPTVNAVVVGSGGDQNGARTFTESTDAASIANTGMRIEQYADQRQTTDATQLAQAAQQALAQGAEVYQLEAIPIDVPDLAFGVHYNVGDLVPVVVDGVLITDIVRQLDYSVGENSSSEALTPIIGTPSATSTDDLYKAIHRMAARISALERSPV